MAGKSKRGAPKKGVEKEVSSIKCDKHKTRNRYWQNPISKENLCYECNEQLKNSKDEVINDALIKFLEDNIWPSYSWLIKDMDDPKVKHIIMRTARASGKSYHIEMVILRAQLKDWDSFVMTARKYEEMHTNTTIAMFKKLMFWINQNFIVGDWISKEELIKYDIPDNYRYIWQYNWDELKQAKQIIHKKRNNEHHYVGYRGEPLGYTIAGHWIIFRREEIVSYEDKMEVADEQVETKTKGYIGSIGRDSKGLKKLDSYNRWRPTHVDDIAEKALPKEWKKILKANGMVYGKSPDGSIAALEGNVYKLNWFINQIYAIFTRLGYEKEYKEAIKDDEAWEKFKGKLEDIKHEILEVDTINHIKGLLVTEQEKWIDEFFKYKIMEVEDPIQAKTEVWGEYMAKDGGIFPAEVTQYMKPFNETTHPLIIDQINNLGSWHAGLDWGKPSGGDNSVLSLIGTRPSYIINNHIVEILGKDIDPLDFRLKYKLQGSDMFFMNRTIWYNGNNTNKQKSKSVKVIKNNIEQKEDVIRQALYFHTFYKMTKRLWINIDSSSTGLSVMEDLNTLIRTNNLQEKLFVRPAHKWSNMSMGHKDREDNYEKMATEGRIFVHTDFIEPFTDELHSIIRHSNGKDWNISVGDADPIDSYFYAHSYIMHQLKDVPFGNKYIRINWGNK